MPCHTWQGGPRLSGKMVRSTSQALLCTEEQGSIPDFGLSVPPFGIHTERLLPSPENLLTLEPISKDGVSFRHQGIAWDNSRDDKVDHYLKMMKLMGWWVGWSYESQHDGQRSSHGVIRFPWKRHAQHWEPQVRGTSISWSTATRHGLQLDIVVLIVSIRWLIGSYKPL